MPTFPNFWALLLIRSNGAELPNCRDAFFVVLISHYETLSIPMVYSSGYRGRFGIDGFVYDHQSRVECVLLEANLH